jgi:hypothetical protein
VEASVVVSKVSGCCLVFFLTIDFCTGAILLAENLEETSIGEFEDLEMVWE